MSLILHTANTGTHGEPAMIVGFGGVVGFVALSLLQAIYGINASRPRWPLSKKTLTPVEAWQAGMAALVGALALPVFMAYVGADQPWSYLTPAMQAQALAILAGRFGAVEVLPSSGGLAGLFAGNIRAAFSPMARPAPAPSPAASPAIVPLAAASAIPSGGAPLRMHPRLGYDLSPYANPLRRLMAEIYVAARGLDGARWGVSPDSGALASLQGRPGGRPALSLHQCRLPVHGRRGRPAGQVGRSASGR